MTLVTERDDQRAGEATLAMLVDSIGLVRDPALQAYVQKVGSRLAAYAPASSFPYRFQVIDTWTPNAFALPGGSILVSRGMVAIAESEDELAGVLAHEIVHVAHRHMASQLALGEKPFGVDDLYWAASLAQHAQDQERDADHTGQQIAAAAGYDPLAFAALLRKTDQVARVDRGAARIPSYFSTHPSWIERAAAAAATGQQLRWRPQPGIAADREAYLRNIAALAVGDDGSQCDLRLEGYHFRYPGLDLAIRFPPFAWELSCSGTLAAGTLRNPEAVLEVDWDGSRDDPKNAAGRFLAQLAGSDLEVVDARAFEIEGRAAFGVRVWNEKKAISGEHVWMTYDGALYHVLAVAASDEASESLLSGARATAHSFRPLTPAERQSIRVVRLAVVEAQSGETVETLGKRLGNTWDPQFTAAINGVTRDHRLEAGHRVKIARSEPLDR